MGGTICGTYPASRMVSGEFGLPVGRVAQGPAPAASVSPSAYYAHSMGARPEEFKFGLRGETCLAVVLCEYLFEGEQLFGRSFLLFPINICPADFRTLGPVFEEHNKKRRQTTGPFQNDFRLLRGIRTVAKCDSTAGSAVLRHSGGAQTRGEPKPGAQTVCENIS